MRSGKKRFASESSDRGAGKTLAPATGLLPTPSQDGRSPPGIAMCRLVENETGPMDYRYLSVNTAFLAMAGADPSGRLASEVHGQDSGAAAKLMAPCLEAIASGRSFHGTIAFRPHSPPRSIESFPCQAGHFLLLVADESADRATADLSLDRSMADIVVLNEGAAASVATGREVAAELDRSPCLLLPILDAIETPVFVADLETDAILYANRRGKGDFGQDLIGRSCVQILPREDRPCGVCPSGRTLPDGPAPNCHWEHFSPITERWYEVCDHAVPWIDGRMVRMQVVFDVTERKEAEFKLRQMQKMEAIGLLAGGVAHDFNNVLSVILGYATMAIEELGESVPLVRNDLEQIERAGLRAKDLVGQILAFCRRSEEQFQPLKLHLIVNEVVKMLRSSFPATIQVDAQITAMDRMALADPSQIHQVLMNLCTNALHAMRNGGELIIGLHRQELLPGERSRALRALPPGSYLRLSVSDTGVGIDPEVRERIFEPFFTTKGEGEGTGLGLAMVQSIVAGHKGAITVNSRPGEGATFSVYLPEYLEAAEIEQPQVGSALPRGAGRILVVDDEPAVADVLQRLLRNLGYEAMAFTESPKAFDAFATEGNAFDLVITDMTMPKFTGLALARAMLALRPGQPIIICTGFSDSIDEQSAQAEGIRELLAKPVSLETLARAVRRALDDGGAVVGEARS